MKQHLHVQAHRGASLERRENSLESIERAAELGADSIEIDIHLLKDETLGVFHDFYAPLATGKKFIGDCTACEMKTIGAPTLPQVFDLLKKQASSSLLWVDLEIKYLESNPLSPERAKLIDSVLNCVSHHWELSRTKFRSFDWLILKEFQKFVSTIQTIPLLDRNEYSFAKAIELQTEWVAPYFGSVSEKDISFAHRLGVKLMPYTVNAFSDWKKLLEWGIDGITTDDPDGLLTFVGRK